MVEKIGPYRVYERLGVGGMGEVFKAYDDRLDRWVAIKRIRPDREDAEDNRERFKREARATARLNHPAIVHLYGIFQEGESDCIVMEYVEGRTLDSILAEGPLDPLRVASLGHEIASGLAEAHANGILHRDLKAENIIITPRGRSKILDFGLAKPILRSELDPVLTGKGQLVGTSRAMSPEYVSGDNVDHRSDLFALGVLLYETLTGQSPFKAHNTLATLKQVMLHKQTPVKQLAPKVPQELSDLIDRLLEKDPADRPQSAHEVALAFGRLTGQISSGTIDQPSSGTQPIFKPTTSTGTPFSASDTVLDLRPRSRWMTVVAVLVALLITAFFLGRYLSDDAKTVGTKQAESVEPIQVLLGEFKNSTGQPIFDESVAALFRTSLEQSETLSLLSPGQIKAALGRMEKPLDSRIDTSLGAELAQREGAKWLITGDISKIGSTYSISAKVIRPEDQVTRFTANETVSNEEGIIAAIQKVGNDIRNDLGESTVEIERVSQPLEKVTTPDFEALRAYTIGSQKYQEGLNQEAISFLERALEFDPAFAMAHAKLVAVYSAERNRSKAIEHSAAAQKHRDRLTEMEKFYVDGWTHRWTGTPQDVIQNWAKMSNLHPNEFAGHRNLGVALWFYQNDFAGAASAFEKALAIDDPRQAETASFLGYCLLGSGQAERARPFFEIAARHNRWSLVDFHLAMGERPAAEKLISEIQQLPPSYISISLACADRGALRDAEAYLKEAVKPFFDAPKASQIPLMELADLAAVMYFLEETSALADFSERIRTRLEPRSKIDGLSTETSPMTVLTLVGKLLARTGQVPKARALSKLTKEISEEIELPLWSAHQNMLEAEILMASSNPEAALDILDTTLSKIDLVTLRESRATCLELMGQLEAAKDEWRRVADSRPRAFAEGHLSSQGRLFAVASTSIAEKAIGRIAEKLNDPSLADKQRKAFANRWPDYRPSN